MLMRSGDAMIMSGPSRLCYHGTYVCVCVCGWVAKNGGSSKQEVSSMRWPTSFVYIYVYVFFHSGVPCILPNTCPPELLDYLRIGGDSSSSSSGDSINNNGSGSISSSSSSSSSSQEGPLLSQYLETHRINFNLRQITNQ